MRLHHLGSIHRYVSDLNHLAGRKGDKEGNKTYSEELNPVQTAIVQQSIVPVSVPILEKDPIQLIVHSGVRGTKIDGHALLGIRMDEEVVDAACFHRHFTIFSSDAFLFSVDIDSHHSRLHAEVLRLELMEVGRGAFGPVRAVDQLAQVVGNGALNIVSVSLAEEKTSSRRWLEEFSGEKTAEPD